MDSAVSQSTDAGADAVADSSADAIKYEAGIWYPELFASDAERALSVFAFEDATPVELAGDVTVDKDGATLFSCKVLSLDDNGEVAVVKRVVRVPKELHAAISATASDVAVESAELMPVINRMAEHRKLAAYSDAVRSNPQHAARLDRAIAMLRSGKRHNNTRPGEIADSGLCRVFFVGSNAPRLYYRTGAEGLEIWGESSFNDGDACRDFLRGLDWSE